MAMERTLSIVKPDAVARNLIGAILRKFESAGLRIAGGKLIRLTPEQAQAFYAVHKARPFFQGLCDYMSSGPIFVSVLEGDNAIAKNREVMGATDPAKAAAGYDPPGVRSGHRKERRARFRWAGYRCH